MGSDPEIVSIYIAVDRRHGKAMVDVKFRCSVCDRHWDGKSVHAPALTDLTREWRYGNHGRLDYCPECGELGQLIIELPN